MPSPDLFRDVTSNSALPRLTEEDKETFCELIGREDVERSAYIMNNIFSWYAALPSKMVITTITSVCVSEMRKKVTYNVIIKAKDHVIIEAQCECAEGQDHTANANVLLFWYVQS